MLAADWPGRLAWRAGMAGWHVRAKDSLMPWPVP